MIDAFITFIRNEKLFTKSDKILLCVSGGVDSVVMCELFHKAGLKFGIAHCNFQLRGQESEEDELFVEELAEKYGVKFHSVTFDTSAFAKKKKLSIQVAARRLRYDWFEEIRTQFDYSFIATAHHQDDSIETFFINLIRGTGIAGLHGILPKQNHLIRPLLFTNKEEVLKFAKKSKLEFREDSSNTSEKYTRNKIRQQLIPLLKELNPDIHQTITRDIQRLKDTEKVYKLEIDRKRSKIVTEGKNGSRISIPELKKLKPLSPYLFEFLSPFGFNSAQLKEIMEGLDGLSGKQFLSGTHRLVKDRDVLIVESREPEAERTASGVAGAQRENVGRRKKGNPGIQISKNETELVHGDLQLTFKIKQKTHSSRLRSPNAIANLDLDKLKFPLVIRKWEQGDVFHPFGMKGKKKLSDLFIDHKLSLPEKENTWLLTSAGKIVWVIGMRMDERFKVTDKTRKIYQVQRVF